MLTFGLVATPETPTAPAQGAVRIFQVKAGAAEEIDWDALRALDEDGLAQDDAWIWVHIDRSDRIGRRWLEEEAGLTRAAYEAMTFDDTRPRAAQLAGGLLLVLRGPNREAESETDDLVSIRLFITRRRVISVRLRPFAPTFELAQRYAEGAGPATPAAFLDQLIDIGLETLEHELDRLGARIDEMEELALAEPSSALKERRAELNTIKRAVVARRRYLRPQQDALARLAVLSLPWLDPEMKPQIAEAADQTGRLADDLDELRERATLIADEMHARMADRLNRTMVTLAVVSTVFLPLTVLTGLLGVNLAGIPFAGSPYAFFGFLSMLAGVALLTAALVRRLLRI